MIETIKTEIKEWIENVTGRDVILEVDIVPTKNNEKNKIIIGIETKSYSSYGRLYNLDDYENDRDLIEKIIIDNLEALCDGLYEKGWEDSRENYRYSRG